MISASCYCLYSILANIKTTHTSATVAYTLALSASAYATDTLHSQISPALPLAYLLSKLTEEYMKWGSQAASAF